MHRLDSSAQLPRNGAAACSPSPRAAAPGQGSAGAVPVPPWRCPLLLLLQRAPGWLLCQAAAQPPCQSCLQRGEAPSIIWSDMQAGSSDSRTARQQMAAVKTSKQSVSACPTPPTAAGQRAGWGGRLGHRGLAHTRHVAHAGEAGRERADVDRWCSRGGLGGRWRAGWCRRCRRGCCRGCGHRLLAALLLLLLLLLHRLLLLLLLLLRRRCRGLQRRRRLRLCRRHLIEAGPEAAGAGGRAVLVLCRQQATLLLADAELLGAEGGPTARTSAAASPAAACYWRRLGSKVRPALAGEALVGREDARCRCRCWRRRRRHGPALHLQLLQQLRGRQGCQACHHLANKCGERTVRRYQSSESDFRSLHARAPVPRQATTAPVPCPTRTPHRPSSSPALLWAARVG